MKKIIIFFLLIICANTTTAKQEDRLRFWIDQPESEVVKGWGPPTSSYTLKNGDKILKYTSSKQWLRCEYNVKMKKFHTLTYSVLCINIFTINKNGIVTSWKQKGSCDAP